MTQHVIIPIIIIVVIAAFVVFLKKKFGVNEYDERQEQIRGTAYKLAFFAVLIASAAYSIFIRFYERPLMQDGVSTMLAALFGVMVFAVVCIWKDAFFSIKNSPTSYILLITAVVILEGYTGFMKIKDGQIFEDGLLTFNVCYPAMTVVFLVILVTILLKLFVLKERED